MKFTRSARSKCKMKLSLQGPSGSGKTYSALHLAKGLTGDLQKVAVIDSENGSSHLYSHLGEYSVLNLQPPFSPEKYIQAISLAINEGYECVIIDSLSHEWCGQGGILDIHSNMQGNSFTNWSKLTPRHNALIQTIVNADVHVIATLRSKTDYVIEQNNGKSIPQKVGLKAVQRDDSEYEFTISFELQHNFIALVSKDRTGLFTNEPELKLDEGVGKKILKWCNIDEVPSDDFSDKIANCSTLESLRELYYSSPEIRDVFRDDFESKKEELINLPKFKQNGSIK